MKTDSSKARHLPAFLILFPPLPPQPALFLHLQNGIRVRRLKHNLPRDYLSTIVLQFIRDHTPLIKHLAIYAFNKLSVPARGYCANPPKL